MRDYTALATELRQSDAGDTIELTVRFAMIVSIVSFFGVWLNDVTYYGWLAIYCGVHFFYIRTLRRSTQPVQRRTYISMIGTAVFALLLFDGLALYLWTSGDPLGRFGAIAALAGQANFALARHRGLPDLAFIEGVVICATLVCTAVLMGLDEGRPSLMFGGIFISLSIGGHFAMSLYDNYKADLAQKAENTVRAREARLKSIGQLTAGVAHDFNNSLTAVLGHLELYTYSDDPKEQSASVLSARLAADRAVTMTQQLLAYARKAPLERRLYDLSEVIEEIISDFRSVHEADGAKAVDISLPDDLDQTAPFWVDGGRMQSAVGNLLGNAVEAIGEDGSVSLSVAFENIVRPIVLPHGSRLTPGRFVAITVTDNGTGIQAEDFAHITEPFWTTKGHANGSGLGLAMAHGFAEQSGGGLDIRSKPNKGTVATLHLPYLVDPA